MRKFLRLCPGLQNDILFLKSNFAILTLIKLGSFSSSFWVESNFESMLVVDSLFRPKEYLLILMSWNIPIAPFAYCLT